MASLNNYGSYDWLTGLVQTFCPSGSINGGQTSPAHPHSPLLTLRGSAAGSGHPALGFRTIWTVEESHLLHRSEMAWVAPEYCLASCP